MMRKTNVVMAILGLTLMVACNSNRKPSDINLNDGEKWKVNAEMKPHIEKGNLLLADFIAKKDQDFHTLAKNLQTQNNALIKSCTMKGESHDELHKWLHPHMEIIKKLSNATDLKEAKGIVVELEKSFETYHNHFQ